MWQLIKNGWMTFAHVIGRVQTSVLLSIVYHGAVGPLSIFARVSGRDVMDLKPPRRGGTESYSVVLPPITTTIERAQRQF